MVVSQHHSEFHVTLGLDHESPCFQINCSSREDGRSGCVWVSPPQLSCHVSMNLTWCPTCCRNADFHGNTQPDKSWEEPKANSRGARRKPKRGSLLTWFTLNASHRSGTSCPFQSTEKEFLSRSLSNSPLSAGQLASLLKEV